jgi:hypothetical protein
MRKHKTWPERTWCAYSEPVISWESPVPQEGHVLEFPLWSYSKYRSTVTRLHINYADGSFFELEAPKGMPSPSFPGYLDCILFYGQKDLFIKEHTEISVYSIFKTLGLDPTNGGNYVQFHRDMRRAFALFMVTDRFRDPATGQRSHVDYFRVLQRMRLAKSRKDTSTFYFDSLFLASLRSGYLKRLDWGFALHLDKQGASLARFLYGHLLKRIGEKSMYQRNVVGFLTDIGLGHIAQVEPRRLKQRLKTTLFPALDLLKGEVIRHYETDTNGNLLFIPKN